MQTFMPLPSFIETARVLDYKRLGKQRVEVLQLLNGNGWNNHPAKRMWLGYTDALVAYGLAICQEWISRGYLDTTYEKILAYRTGNIVPAQFNVACPKWIGHDVFHASHRGNLLRKDPVFYGQYGWKDSPMLPYLWPRSDGNYL